MRQRIALVVLLPLLLLLSGTAGYAIIEGWSAFDALYMTVITLTTIGFGETHPLSGGGRLFTMALALGGIFSLFYAGTEVVRFTVSGELRNILGRRRMEKLIAGLDDHVVVCGYGRMGQYVCEEFSRQAIPFVVIDRDPARLADVHLANGHTVQGDATDDAVLREAGIERARSLVTVVASDSDNLFITMSARLLNERLSIVARAEETATPAKLLRAGATRVISPYVLSGARVAQAVLKPTVVDLLELATRKEHLDLQIEEVPIRAGAKVDGRSIAESGLRTSVGLILVAVKQRSGHMLFNPKDDAALAVGDTLIVMGRREQLDVAERLATGS